MSLRSAIGQSVLALGAPLSAIRRPAGVLPPVSRAAFSRLVERPALEIGPFDCPVLTGDHVEYCDILDQDGLRARAVEHGRNPDGCPYIHHVGSLSGIDRRFRAVFSSHAIEHQPDLIAHLEEVDRLLEPGGAYFLIIPDKRYCFDHFLPATTLSEVRAAIGRSRPTKKAVREHSLRTGHNRAILHWLGVHGKPTPDHDRFTREMKAFESGEYVDVHQWMFTPASFEQLMDGLGLFEATVYDTAFGSLEFMAVLRRG